MEENESLEFQEIFYSNSKVMMDVNEQRTITDDN